MIELASEAAVLMCVETGQILYEKNPDEQLYPASITKILTGLVALKYGDRGALITLSGRAYDSVPRDSAHIELLIGETFPMEDALYAIAIMSANDAAAGIAETVGGSLEGFAELMNQEAEASGAINSNFINPHGLPHNNHYTTARDMALITAAAIQTPGFLEIYGSTYYEMPDTNYSYKRIFEAKNKFAVGEYPCEGLLFSKTGWTSAAQGTLVTVARRNGVTLIAVTLRSYMTDDKYYDTMALYDYGFEQMQTMELKQELLQKKLLDAGLDDKLMPSEGISFLVEKNADLQLLKLRITGEILEDGEDRMLPVSVGWELENASWQPVYSAMVALDNVPEPEPETEITEAAKTLEEEPEQEKQITLDPMLIAFIACVLIIVYLILHSQSKQAARRKRAAKRRRTKASESLQLIHDDAWDDDSEDDI